MEHLEIIKYGVNKLLDRIYGLVRQIWNEEWIPEEWKQTITVTAHKRGNRDKCKNYSRTALGNAAYKILLNKILGKIKLYTEKIKVGYQNGFRDGRTVIDNIRGGFRK
jgi:hypothetical protein